MDTRPQNASPHPVVITGLGHVISRAGTSEPAIQEKPPCDPRPYLKVKKLRKFMGVQDDLAVVSAGLALGSAGLSGVSLGERTGLYLAVGYIPFEQADIEELLTRSLEGDRFCMAKFSTTGFDAVNPLLTFRCLPNMPAYHISANFDLQGPYLVTYPGPGQFYLALEEASAALTDGIIDVALVGGVAHQRNFLVTRHFNRIDPPVAADRLTDAAGCLVLETLGHAKARSARIRGRLLGFEVAYRRHHPFETTAGLTEYFECDSGRDFYSLGEMGPASLPAVLSLEAEQKRGRLRHHLESRDGIFAQSEWELL